MTDQAFEGDPLSSREKEIYQLLFAEKSMKEIAQELRLSTDTVKSHCSSIYKKLGIAGGRVILMAQRIERLQTDANVLLAVVPLVNEIKEWAETHDELGHGDERDWEAEAMDRDQVISEWLSKAQDILAALPERLKEEA